LRKKVESRAARIRLNIKKIASGREEKNCTQYPTLMLKGERKWNWQLTTRPPRELQGRQILRAFEG